MEHLFNCHGEWLYALQVLALVPFAGVWLRTKLHVHTESDHDRDLPA